MRTIVKLVAAAFLAATALSSAPGASIAATQSPPWYAAETFYTGGSATGEIRYYCNGNVWQRGDVWSYDSSVYVEYYECP